MNKSESKYFNTAIRFDKALISLLEEKPFEYITIKEICEKAGVNRSTFYLHYENLSDLLSEATEFILDNFTASFSADRKSIVFDISAADLNSLNFINSQYLHPYLSYVRENRRFFITVLSRPEAFNTAALYKRLFDNIFDPILDRFHYPEEDRQFVMMFYLNGITAVISEWLRSDCSKSINEITSLIQYCIFGRSN